MTAPRVLPDSQAVVARLELDISVDSQRVRCSAYGIVESRTKKVAEPLLRITKRKFQSLFLEMQMNWRRPQNT